MTLDSLASARAVREPIMLNENVRNAYDSITYNKGLAVIGMVDAYFGADVFRPALGRYVEAYEDGVANSPEFFDIIGEETGVPELTQAFRSFVEQNGLPLVTLQMDDAGAVQVSQSRYAPLGSRLTDDRTWTIPLCIVRRAGEARERTCQLMTDKAIEFASDADGAEIADTQWILPNAKGAGYYRFSMSDSMWQDLGRAFRQLNAAEKLVTLDSVGAEFAAGRMQVDTLWRYIDEGARDEERRVVQAAIHQARQLARHVEDDDVALAGYRAAIRDVFGSRDVSAKPANAAEQAILSSSLERFLSRTGNDQVLRQVQADAAANLIQLPGISSDRVLNTDEYMTALAIGLQVYGEAFLDQLLIASVQIDQPAFGQAAAYAIGQNRDPALSDRILALALTGELGSRETETVIRGQMAQSTTRAKTWAWLNSHFETYLEVIPRQRKRASPALANALCDATGRDQLVALFEESGDLAEGHERALAQTVERIELCVALAAGKGEEVRAFFRRGG